MVRRGASVLLEYKGGYVILQERAPVVRPQHHTTIEARRAVTRGKKIRDLAISERAVRCRK